MFTASWTPLVFVDPDFDLGLCSSVGRVATTAWSTLSMKLGFASFVSAAVTTSAIAGAVAQCPDFTTYSQVCVMTRLHSSRNYSETCYVDYERAA